MCYLVQEILRPFCLLLARFSFRLWSCWVMEGRWMCVLDVFTQNLLISTSHRPCSPWPCSPSIRCFTAYGSRLPMPMQPTSGNKPSWGWPISSRSSPPPGSCVSPSSRWCGRWSTSRPTSALVCFWRWCCSTATSEGKPPTERCCFSRGPSLRTSPSWCGKACSSLRGSLTMCWGPTCTSLPTLRGLKSWSFLSIFGWVSRS